MAGPVITRRDTVVDDWRSANKADFDFVVICLRSIIRAVKSDGRFLQRKCSCGAVHLIVSLLLFVSGSSASAAASSTSASP